MHEKEDERERVRNLMISIQTQMEERYPDGSGEDSCLIHWDDLTAIYMYELGHRHSFAFKNGQVVMSERSPLHRLLADHTTRFAVKMIARYDVEVGKPRLVER
jgi:hypothetical protein